MFASVTSQAPFSKNRSPNSVCPRNALRWQSVSRHIHRSYDKIASILDTNISDHFTYLEFCAVYLDCY